jgi:hypothetical protein
MKVVVAYAADMHHSTKHTGVFTLRAVEVAESICCLAGGYRRYLPCTGLLPNKR